MMSNASLAQWLQRLEQLHPRDIELGLERVSRVAGALDLLRVDAPLITVAGTNGKGTTVAVAEALLGRLGKLTGAYTSPHFLRFNERIRVGGQEVADQEIIEAFAAIEAARGDTSLTYFEFATLAALHVFRARDVDVVLLEVGLGGRLDAVNIVDADVAVITRIDLDHQDWLGDSLDQIGREKAGVLRAGKAAVIADPFPPAGLLQALEASGAEPVYRLGSEYGAEARAGAMHISLAQGGEGRELPPLCNASLLPENVAGALQAVTALGEGFSDADAVAAVEGVSPTGRRQALTVAGKRYVLDVAHNPSAVDKLREYLDISDCSGRTIALFSAMSDKDMPAMIDAAGESFDGWFLADQPDNPRALGAAEIAAALRERDRGPVSVSDNLRQAFRRADSLTQAGDRLVVFGSFYTVAGVMPSLAKNERRYGAA